MSALGYNDLQTLWVQAGGDPAQAPVAAAIGMAESGGNPNALNNNPNTGDYSVGLWQINLFGNLWQARAVQRGWTPEWLQNPFNNAQAAVALSNGGASFAPWTTYTSGAYQRFIKGSPYVPSPNPNQPSQPSSACVTNWSILGANLCMDGIIGGLAVALGSAVALAGVVVMIALTMKGTQVGRGVNTAARAFSGPVGLVHEAQSSFKQRRADRAATAQRASVAQDNAKRDAQTQQHVEATRRAALRQQRAKARILESQARTAKGGAPA